MLGKGPPPNRRDLVAGLQYRSRLGRLPAAHQPQMPPMLTGQQLRDQRALAVSAYGHDKPSVPPLHHIKRTKVNFGPIGVFRSFPQITRRLMLPSQKFEQQL